MPPTLFKQWPELGNPQILLQNRGFPGRSVVKKPPATQETSGVGKIPWRRKWQPTPVFLPGKSHGQRSLVGVHGGQKRVGHDLATNNKTLQNDYSRKAMHISEMTQIGAF